MKKFLNIFLKKLEIKKQDKKLKRKQKESLNSDNTHG